MHEDGRTVFLEVVSTSREDELRSIEAGLELGVDVLMGGTNHDAALDLIGKAPVRYFPFPGTVVGHPSELQGSIDEISAHASELTSRPGVHGLDLLAFRHRSVDPVELTRAVVASSQQSGGGGGLDRRCSAHRGRSKAPEPGHSRSAEQSSTASSPGAPTSAARSNGPWIKPKVRGQRSATRSDRESRLSQPDR